MIETTNNTYGVYGTVTALSSSQVVDGSQKPVSYATYGYDSKGNQTSASVYLDGNPGNTGAANLLTTSIAYNGSGMPLSTTAPGGFQTTYGYDSTGTFQTSAAYPTPSSGVALSTSATYDVSSGALLTGTGFNSGQTSSVIQYDALLRPTVGTTPNQGSLGQGQSTVAYSPSQVSARTTMNASQTADSEAYMDAYGRTIRTSVQSSSGWYVTDTCYTNGVMTARSAPYLNSSANPSSINCASSNATLYTLDALGRPTRVATPDGHVTTTSYNGRAVQIADSNGQTKILQYDALGRIAGVCEIVPSGETWDGGDATGACGASGLSFDLPGTGFTTAYTYNLAAHSLMVSQGAQSPRMFQIDAAGRTVSTTEPESGTTTFTYAYNGTGLQTVRTRPRANQTNATVTTATTTQYDTVGRVLDITYNDGTPRKHFVYDAGVPGGLVSNSGPGAKGQLTGTATVDANNSVINAGGIAYDIMGRVNQTADCPTGWCSNPALTGYRAYNYDLASQLTYEAYSTQPNGGSGYSVAYGYNVAGQLTSFIDGQNSAVGAPNIYSATASTMQPGGPQFITYGNNTTAWRQYDSMNRLTGQWVCGLPGGYNCPNGSHYFYGYGTVRSGSMLTAETDTVNGDWSQYSYDNVGNLSSAQNWYGNASNGFSAGYDRYGNRWGESVTHTANGTGPNQSLSFNTTKNQINSAGFVYDAAGNLISDGAHSYQYDAENNLLQIDNGNTATFYYTAQNRRDAVVNSAGVFRFGFDASGRRSTQWDNNSASVNQTQYYAAGEAVAFWSAVDGNINFEYHDWIGTARMRTDLNGNPATAASFSSLPFGEPNATGGADLDSAHFTGLDQDGSFSASSLGLHHATFREYNSTLGRWMSPDPYSGSYNLSNPQSFNRYSYVLNNPLALIDPFGLSCQSGSGGISDDGDGAGCAGNVSNDGSGVAGWDLNPGDGTDVDGGDGGWDGSPGPSSGVTGIPLIYLGGKGGGGIDAPNRLTPANPCGAQGSAESPQEYARLGTTASAYGPVVFSLYSAAGFPRGSFLDAQPKAGIGSVLDRYAGLERAAYGNYVYGDYMAAAGVPLGAALNLANLFAISSTYSIKNGPISSTYTHLPEANVANITRGYTDQINGTLCHR